MKKSKKSAESFYGEKPASRVLGEFRGVDVRGGNAEKYLEYTENMWRDPVSRGICTVPGYRRLRQDALGGRIHSVQEFYNGASGYTDLAVHAGETLCIFPEGRVADEPFVVEGLADRRCSIVSHKGRLWIFDGESPMFIEPDGVSDYTVGHLDEAYVPTVLKDGEPWEKRNMLTDLCYEETSLPDRDILRPTASLKYSLDDASGSATVIGMSTADTMLYIPGTVTLNGREYKVDGVAESAFEGNTGIKFLVIGSGVSVGRRAFKNCLSLSFVAFESLAVNTPLGIADEAFAECPIDTLYLAGHILASSSSPLTVGERAFGVGGEPLSGRGARIFFSENAEIFRQVGGIGCVCDQGYPRLSLEVSYDGSYDFYYLPIAQGIREVENVNDGGESLVFGSIYRSTTVPPTVRYIMVALPKEDYRGGHKIRLTCKQTSKAHHTSFGSCNTTDAARGCRLAACFDGRLFLSGNAELPNTVFYTAEGEDRTQEGLYIPEDCCFDDGAEDLPNADMVASAGVLAVIKEGIGGAYIHRAKGKEDGEYSAGEIYDGIGALGIGSCAFFGGRLFSASKGGVRGITLTGSGKMAFDASASSRELLLALEKAKEEEVSLARFYPCLGGESLAVCICGRTFLTDSESVCEDGAPSWYMLDGIGAWDGTVEEYTPSASLPEYAEGCYALIGGDYVPLCVPDGDCESASFEGLFDPLGKVSGEAVISKVYKRTGDEVYVPVPEMGEVTVGIYKELSCDGNISYCISEPTGAMCGGTLDPAVTCIGMGGTLWLGTEGGMLSAFNMDMRGRGVYRFDTEYEGGLYADVYGQRLEISPFDGEDTAYSEGGELLLDIFDSSSATETLEKRHCVFFPESNELRLLSTVDGPVEADEIHPYFYRFDGRSVYSCALTVKDDMGEIDVVKSTVRGSVVLAAPVVRGGRFFVRCRTDEREFFTVEEICAGYFDMDRLDFSSLSFSGESGTAYYPLNEKCRGYMWRQYYIGGLGAPVGIFKLTSRYVRRAFKGR